MSAHSQADFLREQRFLAAQGEQAPEARDAELRFLRAENARLAAEVERLKEFEWKYQELCR